MGYSRPDQLTIQWNGTSFAQCLIDYLPFSAPTRPRLQLTIRTSADNHTPETLALTVSRKISQHLRRLVQRIF